MTQAGTSVLDSHLRPDLARIAQWIAPGSRVLDLGCGDGALLAALFEARHVRGAGVEIDDAQVIECVRRGVPVIQQNLENGLALFDNKQFETVVLSQTLQSMHHTEHILREMGRVARQGIVSFPNFGYWRYGMTILAGRMPVSGQMPYQWYNTPNIHLCTLGDFESLARAVGLSIIERATFLRAARNQGIAGVAQHVGVIPVCPILTVVLRLLLFAAFRSMLAVVSGLYLSWDLPVVCRWP
jgi:methionine biosynthesis protein MetW